jgi:hypothetical protein
MEMSLQTGNTEITGANWLGLYKFAGMAALLVVFVAMLDIGLAILGGPARENSTITTLEWFTHFQTKPFSAFSNLGLMNIIYQIAAIPLYLALCHIHRKGSQAFAVLAFVFFCIGAAVYFSTNTVFSVFALSRQYALAVTDPQKAALLAAGDAALAQGADLTPGVFLGFFLSELAGIGMALVLLQDGIFGRITAWLGLLAMGCMLVFNSLAAFAPASYSLAMMFASLGGPLSMAYYIMLARRLFQLGKAQEARNV